jgi:hypothetical protein
LGKANERRDQMRRDFIVYPTRREQVGIFGQILDALFGKKKVKTTPTAYGILPKRPTRKEGGRT